MGQTRTFPVTRWSGVGIGGDGCHAASTVAASDCLLHIGKKLTLKSSSNSSFFPSGFLLDLYWSLTVFLLDSYLVVTGFTGSLVFFLNAVGGNDKRHASSLPHPFTKVTTGVLLCFCRFADPADFWPTPNLDLLKLKQPPMKQVG